MPETPTKQLETFANPELARDYTIRMQIPEFTCLCPRTGQPDFATLDLEYVPDRLCVELSSLSLYLWAFRGRGALPEPGSNELAAPLDQPARPRFRRPPAGSTARGATPTPVVGGRPQGGWSPAPP